MGYISNSLLRNSVSFWFFVCFFKALHLLKSIYSTSTLDILDWHGSLVWKYFYSRILKLLHHCLLAFGIAVVKLEIFLISWFIVISLYSMEALKRTFSLSAVCWKFICFPWVSFNRLFWVFREPFQSRNSQSVFLGSFLELFYQSFPFFHFLYFLFLKALVFGFELPGLHLWFYLPHLPIFQFCIFALLSERK